MKFPKTIFVKVCNDGHGNEYLDPHIKIDTTVDAGETARVAIYKLSEVVEARGSVTTISTKAAR